VKHIQIEVKTLKAEKTENKAEKECLADCLARLPEPEQEIIRLKFAAEFNNRQIAKMLGLSESNVGVKLFRAVKKLRDDFQEPGMDNKEKEICCRYRPLT
jgi:RNA polymerase sigma-70 factor (ECF subfamily)